MQTEGEVTYRVWRMEDMEFEEIAVVRGIETRVFADRTARPSMHYTYTVTIEDDRGEGVPSMGDSASTAAAATTRTVRAPQGLEASVDASGAVELSWDPGGEHVAGYLVFRAMQMEAEPETVTPGPVPSASFTETLTAAYQTFWYSVAAVDERGITGSRSAATAVRVRGQWSGIVPHAVFADTGEDRCLICHSVHGAKSPDSLLTAETSRAVCETCHDGTGAAAAVARDLASAFSTHGLRFEAPGGQTCTDCHTPHSAASDPSDLGSLLVGGSGGDRSAFCYRCHGASPKGAGGDRRTFLDSSHGDAFAETGRGGGCLTCHEPHASSVPARLRDGAGDETCLRCHADSDRTAAVHVAPAEISRHGGETSHAYGAVSAEYDSRARISCRNCHDAHAAEHTAPLIDPEDPAPVNAWTAEKGDATDFCLVCHDGSMPDEQQTRPWVDPPQSSQGVTGTADIAATWDSAAHGGGDAEPQFLRASVVDTGVTSLSCRACHDAHGSPNPRRLNGAVSLSEDHVADGLLAFPAPSGGLDVRFYCSGCHDMPEELHPGGGITAFPMDCTSAPGCHSHAGGPLWAGHAKE